MIVTTNDDKNDKDKKEDKWWNGTMTNYIYDVITYPTLLLVSPGIAAADKAWAFSNLWQTRFTKQQNNISHNIIHNNKTSSYQIILYNTIHQNKSHVVYYTYFNVHNIIHGRTSFLNDYHSYNIIQHTSHYKDYKTSNSLTRHAFYNS